MSITSIRVQTIACVIATMVICAVGPLWMILPTGVLVCQQFIWLFNAIQDAATDAATTATLDAIIEIEDAMSDADDAESEDR